MTARILDGRAFAQALKEESKRESLEFRRSHGVAPGVAAVIVGHDLASLQYFREMGEAFQEAELVFEQHSLPEDTEAKKVVSLIGHLNEAPYISGILIARPLPKHIPPELITHVLFPSKDVEGLHPLNLGLFIAGEGDYFVPAAPSGGMEMLHRAEIDVDGKHAVVIGRSNVVGKPMAVMLLRENATVTVCHTHTVDLAGLARQGDILVTAAGRPRLITADMVKPGAVVIDFGTNIINGQLVGDVDFPEVVRVASAVTPVPGGIGPMTTAMVMRNTLLAARRALRLG